MVFIESLADFGNPLFWREAVSRCSPRSLSRDHRIITCRLARPWPWCLCCPVTAFAVQRYYLQKRQYTTVTANPRAAPPSSCPEMRRSDGLRAHLRDVHPPFLRTIFTGASPRSGLQPQRDPAALIYAFSVGLDTIKDTLIVALVSTPLSGCLGCSSPFYVVRFGSPARG